MYLADLIDKTLFKSMDSLFNIPSCSLQVVTTAASVVVTFHTLKYLPLPIYVAPN